MMRFQNSMTLSLTLRDRVQRALSLLGLIGAIITLTQGLSGIIGVVVMIALLDGLIELSMWVWRRIQPYLPNQ